MTAPYQGACACGAITVAIAAEPVATRQCWCRQCRKASGGGASHNAMFRADAVELSGQTGTRAYVAASGSTLVQEFCPTCGTPVLARSSARPQFRTIRFGLIDTGELPPPTMAIWLDDAPRWAVIDPALEQYRRQPPPPPESPSASSPAP